jgi:hypothetical protein
MVCIQRQRLIQQKAKLMTQLLGPRVWTQYVFMGLLAHEEFDAKIMYVGDRIILCVIGLGP